MVVLTVSLGLDLKQFGLHQLVEQLGQLAGIDLIAEIARVTTASARPSSG
jgi:hypothetical protein